MGINCKGRQGQTERAVVLSEEEEEEEGEEEEGEQGEQVEQGEGEQGEQGEQEEGEGEEEEEEEGEVCSRSPALILGSNPTGGMDVSLLRVLCVVR